jgi:hypothetical protein
MIFIYILFYSFFLLDFDTISTSRGAILDLFRENFPSRYYLFFLIVYNRLSHASEQARLSH